ncbi:hypothetical protein EBX31_03085 [bacterium]|nr:hypothetical protein [bacterium]
MKGARLERAAVPSFRVIFDFSWLAAAGFLIFVVPWHVPVRGPIDSQSYVFGFSNAASLLGLAIILMFLFWRRLNRRQQPEKDQGVFSQVFLKTPRGFRTGLGMAAGCALASCLLILGWWMFLSYGFFGETAYFLTRLDMMLLGYKPYRDFEFGYGPAMLWIPWVLSRLSAGFVAIDTSYILTVVLFFILGIFSMHFLVRRFNVFERWANILILFGAITFFNITLGIQYTPIRFLYALVAVFVWYEMARRNRLTGAVGCFFLALGGFLLGPEVGLVTNLALSFGILWGCRNQQFGSPYSLAIPLCALALAYAFFGKEYFAIVLSFGGGAYNFPILPAPYILSLLVLSGWILPKIFSAAWPRGENALLYAALGMGMGLYLPAALGRCDPGHVLRNGAGIFLISTAARLVQKSFLKQTAVLLAYFICLVTMEVSFWNHYDVNIRQAAQIRRIISENLPVVRESEFSVQAEIAKQPVATPFRWDKKMPYSPDLLQLLQYPKFAVVRGGSEDLDRFLKESGRYVSDYFVPPFDSLFSPTSAKKKSESLGKAEFVLVPEARFEQPGEMDPNAYARGWSEFLSGLFLFPVSCRAVNAPFDPDQLILRNLSATHHPVGRFRDMLILQANQPRNQQ